MPHTTRSLTPVEWSLMNICWEKGQSSARDIWEASLAEKKRGYQTVKTMLDRLAVKGFLAREKFGPIWLYTPAVARKSFVRRELDRFIGTVLDNSVAPLFARFAEKEQLSDDDIEKLKKLIGDQEEDV